MAEVTHAKLPSNECQHWFRQWLGVIRQQAITWAKVDPDLYLIISPSATVIFNSPPPSAAYMRQWIRSVLVQTMAWCLYGTKPLSEPMLGYFQLDHWEQISVKFWPKYKTFHSRKCIWKCRLQKGGPFCLVWMVLIVVHYLNVYVYIYIYIHDTN